MNLLTELELTCLPRKTEVTLDVECLPNYFLILIKTIKCKRIFKFEISPETRFNPNLLMWAISHFKIITFNGLGYDIPMVLFSLREDQTTQNLKSLSNELISGIISARTILKENRYSMLPIDHIDIMEVCPLKASLKIYGGRLHCETMRDLPFHHEKYLTKSEAIEVCNYCENDNDITALLKTELQEELDLREKLSDEYKVDLRSKSDAQIAEAVIVKEVERITKRKIIKKDIQSHYAKGIKYQCPQFIQFDTPQLQKLLETVKASTYRLNSQNKVVIPEELRDFRITINKLGYKFANGGLHSKEKHFSCKSENGYKIYDRDVKSYYPRIILNEKLYPAALGEHFLPVFEKIVNDRLAAKESGDTSTANALKIVINGSFGKFGSQYSALFSPNLLLQVTITGQLCLLMLIEKLELYGIEVISANTDGIFIKCHDSQKDLYLNIIKQWEQWCNFETEEAIYNAVFMKDVNNYIAWENGDKFKLKGAYKNPWINKKEKIFRFHKNPVNTICIEAIQKLISENIPVEKTIKECKDIRKFISVKKVDGGAEKGNERTGNSIRWYYAKNSYGSIRYKTNGTKVGKSDGAKLLLTLPVEVPQDLDYDWYIEDAISQLHDIAYYKNPSLFDFI